MLELALRLLLAASCAFQPPHLVPDRAAAFTPVLASMAHASEPRAGAGPLLSSVTTEPLVADGGVDGLALHRLVDQRAQEDDHLGRMLRKALDVCANALRLYGPDAIVTSFNGGKDAVAILHLMRAALAHHDATAGTSSRLLVIFFEQPDEFPEVADFVNATLDQYELECYRVRGMGFADGLKLCIKERGSKAFVLGTRRGDPNAEGQQAFEPSSDWMPPFMRVNPVLEWEYDQVWQFLNGFALPYCSLYKEGYTSLGKTSNTLPNPALLRADGTYGAAWELADASLERAGRVSSSKPKADAAPVAAVTPPEAAAAAAAMGERVAAGSAALLIVGDEILRGKTRDSNTQVAVELLGSTGIALKRVVVVPDDLEAIREELGRMSAAYDVVMTSGGVGPTHDDVTIKGVAAALQVPYEACVEMSALIKAKMPSVTDEVLSKMSMQPRGAVLRAVPQEPDAWPILQVANVFVLPGVPQFFESKLSSIVSHFLLGAAPPLTRKVELRIPELEIVAVLNGVVESHTFVGFGSYPVDKGEVVTIITLEAKHDATEQIEAALEALLSALPEGAVVGVCAVSSALIEPIKPPPAPATGS